MNAVDARDAFKRAYHDRRAWVRAESKPWHGPAPDPLHGAMSSHPLPFWHAALEAWCGRFDPLVYRAPIRLAARKAVAA